MKVKGAQAVHVTFGGDSSSNNLWQEGQEWKWLVLVKARVWWVMVEGREVGLVVSEKVV